MLIVKLRITLAQINLTVGDIAGNAKRMRNAAETAKNLQNAQIIVFPELSLTGYPPEDLLQRPDFLNKIDSSLHELAKLAKGIVWIVGFPEHHQGMLYNSAAVLQEGRIAAVYRKQLLPNYGVFDEKRYFQPGAEPCLFELNGFKIGITICEDVWLPGAVEQSQKAGAKLVLNLNASPYQADKLQQREAAIRDRIKAAEIPIVYVNLIGGQDELVFDGASFVMDDQGQIAARAGSFEECLIPVDFCLKDGQVKVQETQIAPIPDDIASIYQALVLAIRDYVHKNGFQGAVLGLSGGIDSALTLALAVDALGAESVEAVMMPSRYTSDMSVTDAKLQADALGIHYHVLPIEPAFQAFTAILEETFQGLARDTTEENIQARCRGVLLMAISNKKRKILLTTGNKSEMSVGYATLYGDMAGGFAPLKDVPKLLVYQLSAYRNRLEPVIPQRVLDRPPSAELAPDQTDEASLLPYALLDPILECYVEKDQSIEQIIAQGFSEADVRRIAKLVDNNEYKRRQAPPGVKISKRAFGRDRRYPITCRFS